MKAPLPELEGIFNGNESSEKALVDLSDTTVPATIPLSSKQPLTLIPPAQDPLLSYFSNVIMRDGKRGQADETVTKMLELIHTMTRAPPLPILREAVLAASPIVRCISQRKSVKVTQLPIALSERNRTAYGVRWILWASAARPEKTFEGRLAREVVGVLQGDSRALAKKTEMHRVAMVNRANIRTR
ncbi:ribosomal protein S7 [Trametopsis cervina]|nr:ribosomal protein S7 [Trametopsis cervina]